MPAKTFKPSKAVLSLPPYLFYHLVELKKKAKARGREIIDLGMGNPDIPTPRHIVEALRDAVGDSATHRYPMAKVTEDFPRAVAEYYRRRFNVDLDPAGEIVTLIGSKEGIAHSFFALADPGDTVVIPTPAYPAHVNAPYISRTKPYWAPLLEKNNFLMDFSSIPAGVLRKTKLLVLNYPNNPTGAVIEDRAYYKEALALAAKYGFLILYDNPYSEICFDGYKAPSILEMPGAKKHCIEFNSLSKTYSMAGWRIGYALGNSKAIGYLTKFKTFVDYSVSGFIQKAGAVALRGGGEEAISDIYQKRRDAFLEAVEKHAGWPIPKVKASMYLWARVPEKYHKAGSFGFAEKLLLETGVCVSPGVGFGKAGEGYVRIALVESEDKLRRAAELIGCFLKGKPISENNRAAPAILTALV
ncbi:MAG: aminotransferase class I/II-fold pyridoxal phosphate-dependent enzyme [Elusimicrobia bacterium]|nr:aminotransferase class I/II-fold pyridoxal phosphate-dependent enzyme [Elusimicrobiota bacterium]